MVNNAIAKLKGEIEKENNDYVKIIGEFLINRIKDDEVAAGAILDVDKSIIKSLDVMMNKAKAKAKNGYAVLSDDEGFKIVLDYFGITDNGDSRDTVEISKDEFNISLDDLF